MTAKLTSTYIPSVLFILCIALVAGNWYLRPERYLIWLGVLLLIANMAAVFLGSRGVTGEAGRRRARDIRGGIAWGTAILAIALGGKLILRLGASGETDLTWRITMMLLGAFLVFTGNGIPKALTPLSAIHCDAARVQAFQRFGGWLWVVAGLALVFAWLVLPVPSAQLMSSILLPSAMILIGIQWIRVFRYSSQPGKW